MPRLSLSLSLDSNRRVQSSSAGIGFPASINIGRTNTSIWDGDGTYYIGHLSNVAVGQTRNFVKQGTFTNNSNLDVTTATGENVFGSATFVMGKYYKINLGWFENQTWLSYNIYQQLLIGLCTEVTSNAGTSFSGFGWVACSVWSDSSVGDGDAGSYVVAQNSSTDYNNFPTTGWGTGVIVTSA